MMVVWMFLGLYNRQIKSDITLTDLMRAMTIEQARGSIDDNIQTVVVIPTHHQDKKVLTLIRDILEYNHGVIRVDDGHNGDLYQDIATKYKENVVVLRHPRNMGQGAALQTGQKYAKEYTKAQYIIHFDSDGQHQTKDIQTFIDYADHNPDINIIFGSRFLPGSGKIPRVRARHKMIQLYFMKLFV
ncbi:MAG: glycosyltransferase [Candidatus Peribacteria bacterium]|nr:MAG: glycosyltransferase [Candidatus Peribacteria bacterium]